MLRGKLVDLRAVEKEDIPLLQGWYNDPDHLGEFEPFPEQASRGNLERHLLEPQGDRGTLIIQDKGGGIVGDLNHRGGSLHVPVEIGYAIARGFRGKGYATEAVEILVDFLFLTRDIARIQASTSRANVASQRVLEKAGFRREGLMRRSSWVRGRWEDDYSYAIIREEWGGPRVLRTSDGISPGP